MACHARVFVGVNENRQCPDTVSTFESRCPAGELTFGDPFQDSGIVVLGCAALWGAHHFARITSFESAAWSASLLSKHQIFVHQSSRTISARFERTDASLLSNRKRRHLRFEGRCRTIWIIIRQSWPEPVHRFIILWARSHKTRRCQGVTYPESYITTYTTYTKNTRNDSNCSFLARSRKLLFCSRKRR